MDSDVANLPPQLQNKVEVRPDGCWEWTGTITAYGYGAVRWPHPDGRKCHTSNPRAHAHRVVYHLLVDDSVPVYPGSSASPIDHVCRNTACVNPEHLEPVSSRTNTFRRPNRRKYSRYVGVTFHKKSGRWQAAAQIDGRQRYLGLFGTEDAAADAYDRAVLAVDPGAVTNRGASA